MGKMKAIETLYKGYRFRSRLEARWAVFFDYCNVKWEYEPEGFDLGDGIWYLPDFLVHDVDIYARPEDCHENYWENIKIAPFKADIYFEVKGNMTEIDSEKIKQFHKSGNLIFTLGNIPEGNSLFELKNNVSAQYHVPSPDNNYQAALFDGCDLGIDTREMIPCITTGWGSRFSLVDLTEEESVNAEIDSASTLNAYSAARAARFEHGEHGGKAPNGITYYGDGIYMKEKGSVKVYCKDICSANELSVEIGTNGPHGGDAGHGCVTYFGIKDLGGTAMKVNLIDGDYENKGFELWLGGDCELYSLEEALKFASNVLKKLKETGGY